jgi:putative transposase
VNFYSFLVISEGGFFLSCISTCINIFTAFTNRSQPFISGKRVKRGLYKTRNGKLINADINGALNILKKSNVVSLSALYSSGEVDTPVRIRLV